MLAETGSLGVRATTVERWPQRRDDGDVDVDGHPSASRSPARRVKVEHDDAVAAAAVPSVVPLRDVLRRAETAAAALPPIQ